MSSKFTVAALAAAAIVLAAVWFWQDPTRPPATPTAQPLASAPAGSAAADSARLASPPPTTAATDAHPQAAPAPPAETIAALQAAYSEALTAEQRVRRERVQQAFPKLPPTVVVLPENASHNFQVFAVNTSVVFLNLGRREWTEGEGQQLRFDAWCPDPDPAPADADTQPEVGVSSGTTSSNDLWSASHDAWRVTTSGCSSNVSLIDGKIEAVPLTTDQQLGYIDLFNARQPAQYEADAILRQIGLAGIAPAAWEPLLADAREADAALLTAVDAFRDPTHRAESGPMMWRAGERLRAAQADISKEVSKVLRKDPSGTSGYALFMARQIDEKNLLGSTQRVTVKLIIKGECLAQVARLIAENPLAGGTLQVDIQAADLLLDGEYASTSLADLLAQVATAAKVECVREASGRFLLRPAVPPDEAGAGF